MNFGDGRQAVTITSLLDIVDGGVTKVFGAKFALKGLELSA